MSYKKIGEGGLILLEEKSVLGISHLKKRRRIITFLLCKSGGVVSLLLVKWINNKLKLEENGTQPP